MPGGRPRKNTPCLGAGRLFARRLVARAAKPDEAAELNHHVATIDSYNANENSQRQKGHPVTREGPRRTEAVSDRGNATKQKSGAATLEERVAKQKAALAASKEARTISHNAAIEL